MKNIKAIIRRVLRVSLYVVTFVMTPVIFLLLVLLIWEPHIIQVYSCLDNGGRWDYEREECQESSGYPVTPYDCVLGEGDWIQEEGCKVPEGWKNPKAVNENGG